MAEDYYNILGIEKTASADEIKKAYRKLALKYHPDRNPNDKSAEDNFKKVNEAYAVLGDPEKRKQYDSFGSQAFGERFTQEDIFRNFDFNTIFRDLGIGGFGGGNFSHIFTGGRGRYQEAGDPFSQFFGQQQQQYRQPTPQKGQNLEYNLSITLEEAASGTEKSIALKHEGNTFKIKMKVPPGIRSNQKLRVPGKGLPGTHGGSAGDLYLKITVLPHQMFVREDDDITYHKSIPFSQAVLGTTVDIPTIYGETKRIKISPNTQNNTKIRMRGFGMPHFKKTGKGDQYVKISVEVPKKTTKKQKELIEQLAEEGF